jgi:hypothetical protein
MQSERAHKVPHALTRFTSNGIGSRRRLYVGSGTTKRFVMIVVRQFCTHRFVQRSTIAEGASSGRTQGRLLACSIRGAVGNHKRTALAKAVT